MSNKKHGVLPTCSESASTLILLHVVAHAAAHDLFSPVPPTTADHAPTMRYTFAL